MQTIMLFCHFVSFLGLIVGAFCILTNKVVTDYFLNNTLSETLESDLQTTQNILDIIHTDTMFLLLLNQHSTNKAHMIGNHLY